MAIRQLKYQDDEILRKQCREVTEFNDRLAQLLDDMADTMYETGGVGLAAPQVGILKQVVVIDVGDGLIEMVNPEIIEQSGRQKGKEGCLSCPNLIGTVKRPNKVVVRAYDRFGKQFQLVGERLLARAICHETDHLKGILFLDLATDIGERQEKD